MGHKTLPKTLRLNFLQNWESNWSSENNLYANLFFVDYSIRKYISSIVENNKYQNEKYCSKIFIQKQGSYLLIYVYILNLKQHSSISKNNTNWNVNKLELLINKYLKACNLNLDAKIFFVNKPINTVLKNKTKIQTNYKDRKKNRTFNKTDFFITAFKFCLKTKNVQLLNKLFIQKLKKRARQRQYIYYIQKILNSAVIRNKYNLVGYKVQLKGRINGVARSRKVTVQRGKVPLNTINSNIQHDMQDLLTRYGLCSLQIWLSFNK